MLKIRTFRRDTEDMESIDSKPNKWLAKNPDIKIISHHVSMQDEYLITQILYDDREDSSRLDNVLG